VEQSVETTSNSSDDSGVIPPSRNAPKKQRLFSDDELSLIKSHCKAMVTSGYISTKTVTDALNNTFAGRELLKRSKMIQIIGRKNKV
jgi:DNA-binding transcriptional MerR regulator